MNEDIIAPGQGFGMHPHKDMEIITYIVSGSLAHKDSIGNTHVVSAGGVQYMCAGTGVYHSEFNPDKVSDAHIIQIWIEPSATGLLPAYCELRAPESRDRNATRLVISPDGREGSLKINQDVLLYTCEVEKGFSMPLALGQSSFFWLQLVDGGVRIGDMVVAKGDGIYGRVEESLRITATDKSTYLLFGLN
jgi:hypothetical protein